jgi:hypothetical protein
MATFADQIGHPSARSALGQAAHMLPGHPNQVTRWKQASRQIKTSTRYRKRQAVNRLGQKRMLWGDFEKYAPELRKYMKFVIRGQWSLFLFPAT